MIILKNLLPECENCGRDWNHGQDHEASMAHGEIKDAISDASKIQSMIGDNDDLPGWVSSYITLASDYLHSVAEYMAGQTAEMPQPGPGYSMEEGTYKTSPNSIEAQYLSKGDILGSGEEVVSVSAGARTPSGKVELTLTKDGKTRNAVYGKNVKVTRLKKGMEEAEKPSAGLSAAKKSAVAKKASAGKDIGKKGKGFEKIAQAAGGGEKGQKIAAAAMWKNVKR
jgi:hypothetical protein